MPPVPDLPDPLAYFAAVVALYRFGVIPAVRGTLDMLRDMRNFRDGR